MRTTSVPPALRERLGHDATIDLMEYVDSEHMTWSDHVLSIGVERFERRLAQELADLRVTLVRVTLVRRMPRDLLPVLSWGQTRQFSRCRAPCHAGQPAR